MLYFHVCKSETLEIGQTIQHDFFQQPKLKKEFIEYFLKGGLSTHGKNYLLRSGVTDTSQSREFAMEMIRQNSFSSLPSRFQSVFACTCLEDAQKYAMTYVTKPLQIGEKKDLDLWCLESKSTPFVADMNHLDGDSTWLEVLMSAKLYWEGKHTRRPFLEVLLPLPVTVVRYVGKVHCSKTYESYSGGVTCQARVNLAEE